MLRPFGPKAYKFAFRDPRLDRRYSILCGSVRSSKTWSMMIKLLALARYPVAGLKVITGVSKQTIKQNILMDLFELIGNENYSYNQQTGELTLFDSRWLVIGAKDEGSEKYIRGATIGVVYADELVLMPRSFFWMLLTRLSPDGARLYGTTNPDSPFHYLKAEFLDKPELSGDIEYLLFTLEDNPNLGQEYVAATKRSYTGVFYQRNILGLWVVAEGAIYRDVLTRAVWYDDSTRPVGLLGRGGHIERIIAVDYGTTNPCVFIDIYDDGRTWWAHREYYWDSQIRGRQKTDGEYADDLVEFIGRGNRATIIMDPSAASFREELGRRGLFVIDADNEVEDGIRIVSTMLARGLLRINEHTNPNGVKEMQTYAWDKNKSDRGNEEPVKRRDHWPDAIRYAAKTRIMNHRLRAA